MVEQFASRPPDKQMMAWLEGKAKTTRVLGIGCANGRNTEWLAMQGFDFYAVDSPRAMLERSRARVEAYLGQPESLPQFPDTDTSAG